MNSVTCRPQPEDAANLPVVQSIIARFHPGVRVRNDDGNLTLTSETVTEEQLRRTFFAAALTARLSERSNAFRAEVWSRLLR